MAQQSSSQPRAQEAGAESIGLVIRLLPLLPDAPEFGYPANYCALRHPALHAGGAACCKIDRREPLARVWRAGADTVWKAKGV